MTEDKLRRRCEEMLADDEQIVLDAECSVIQSRLLIPSLGSGRAFLTRSRLIWIRRATPPILRRMVFWNPKSIKMPLSEMESVQMIKTGFGAGFLQIFFEGKQYLYRLGKGPYPLLRHNRPTTLEWFRELQDLIEFSLTKEAGGSNDG